MLPPLITIKPAPAVYSTSFLSSSESSPSTFMPHPSTSEAAPFVTRSSFPPSTITPFNARIQSRLVSPSQFTERVTSATRT